MTYYNNPIEYINCTDDDKAKLIRITVIINALEEAELAAAAGAAIEEYMLDTGQTKVKTIYRDIASIGKAIELLQKRKTRLINLCFGGDIHMQDGNVKIC